MEIYNNNIGKLCINPQVLETDRQFMFVVFAEVTTEDLVKDI